MTSIYSTFTVTNFIIVSDWIINLRIPFILHKHQKYINDSSKKLQQHDGLTQIQNPAARTILKYQLFQDLVSGCLCLKCFLRFELLLHL